MMAKGAGSNVQINCNNFYGVLENLIHKLLSFHYIRQLQFLNVKVHP